MTIINADIHKVFDLARDIDLHQKSIYCLTIFFLKKYMTSFLLERNKLIKKTAEYIRE